MSQGCIQCYMMPLNALVLVVHQCSVSQSGACPSGHPKVFPTPLRLLRLSNTTSASLNRQCQMQASVPFSVARFSLSHPRSCLPLFLVGSLQRLILLTIILQDRYDVTNLNISSSGLVLANFSEGPTLW